MVFRAESQLDIERGSLPFAFSPLTLNDNVVEIEFDSNNSKDDEPHGLHATIDFLGAMLSISILFITVILCLLDQQFNLNAPTLHPESFALSKLNITDSNLVTFSTNIDLTFGCKQCDDYEAVFNRINGMILYKDKRVLSMVSKEAFGLRNKELKTLSLKFTSPSNGEKPEIEEHILKEMEDDLGHGRVHLRLKINNLVYFRKWGISWGGNINSYCWDLAVGISDTTGVGKIIGGGRDKCHEP